MSRTATIGMFDGVHLGHRFLLDHIKSLPAAGKPLVVTFACHPLSVISPESAPESLLSAEDKKSRIEEYGCDCAMLDFTEDFRKLSAREFMQWLGKEYDVTRMAMGFNNHLGSDRADFEKCAEIGREIGIEVVAVAEYPANGGVSSSNIRRLIAEGNVEAANKFLGYRYCIAGRVVSGNQIGRTIGFPTANVSVDNERVLIPGAGVYAADVLLADGSRHRAVVNIGHRPTVDNTSALQIEAHILDFSGVIYGQKISISFLKRLRDEQRFSDLNALRDQIALDIRQARDLV